VITYLSKHCSVFDWDRFLQEAIIMGVGRIILVIVMVLFVAAAIACHIIAFVTSHWLTSSSASDPDFLNIGLWIACFDHYIHPHEDPPRVYDGCHYVRDAYYENIQDWLAPSWLVTCQILAIIAVILLAISLALVLFLLLWVLFRWVCCRREDDCCERFIIYATPIMMIIAGFFEMMTAMVFADNAFKLQCKDFWVGGSDPNVNVLSYSWGFEVAACILSFISGGLIIWLAVLKGRDYTYKVVG